MYHQKHILMQRLFFIMISMSICMTPADFLNDYNLLFAIRPFDTQTPQIYLRTQSGFKYFFFNEPVIVTVEH